MYPRTVTLIQPKRLQSLVLLNMKDNKVVAVRHVQTLFIVFAWRVEHVQVWVSFEILHYNLFIVLGFLLFIIVICTIRC